MLNFSQIQNLTHHLKMLLEGYHFCVSDNNAYTNDPDDFENYIESILDADYNELQSTLKFCKDNDISLDDYKEFMRNNYVEYED